MKGGYQIIDLRKLSLELSNSTGNITDVDILNQLRNLREYIEKGHDFTKPLNKALKCVIIRMRDGKNNEKLEACQWANIETSNNSLTYEIKAKGLMIEVVFEEKTDDDGNKYYDIKTAKYLYNHNEIVEGNLTVSGDLTIGGASTFEDTAQFEEDVAMSKDLAVAGDATFQGAINGETNPSVKKIYCHPIAIVYSNSDSDGVYARLTMLVFNNTNTAFTKSSFAQWLKDLYDLNSNAKVLTSGALTKDTVTLIASYIRWTGNAFDLVGINASTGQNGTFSGISLDSLISANSIFEDGVNAIN